MMTEILFTHAYFLRFDQKQWDLNQPYPPLGTLHAAALMRQHGYNIALFDTMFVADVKEVESALKVHQPNFLVIYDDGFNYLTKMCLSNMRNAAFEMCRLAKAVGCQVIISSSDSTDHYTKYLSAGADFVLIGEAEITLLELINGIKKGIADFSGIEGIAFFNNGAVKLNKRRDVLKTLDDLPLPAWDLVDIESYRSRWLKSKGYFSLNMSTTRGCPFKCNWCAKPIYGNRYNSRSAEKVVEEISFLKQQYQVDHIWFCDDIFGLKPGWVSEFAKRIEEAGITIRYKIQSRADLLLQDEQIEALAASGCDNAWIGAESGSQQILDAMDKGTTIAQIYTATNLLRKHNIKPSLFIQFGYPGETKKDIDLTIKMISDLLPHEIGISVSYPLPGTLFYERVKQDLQTKTNWTDSDEMAMMFRNTYPPAYYKLLQQYVHLNYHLHLAKNGLMAILNKPLTINWGKLKKALTVFYFSPATFYGKLKLSRAEKFTT